MGGATYSICRFYRAFWHFNPRSPWGERQFSPVGLFPPGDFNPRSPWGERLAIGRCKHSLQTFQSTLPVGGATTGSVAGRKKLVISIHAPRGGSDQPQRFLCISYKDFNPRSPWGERLGRSSSRGRQSNFNPRSPWGERQPEVTDFAPTSPFQSTLPVGGATGITSPALKDVVFQSTLPVGGATWFYQSLGISFFYFNPRSPWGERQLRGCTR